MYKEENQITSATMAKERRWSPEGNLFCKLRKTLQMEWNCQGTCSQMQQWAKISQVCKGSMAQQTQPRYLKRTLGSEWRASIAEIYD